MLLREDAKVHLLGAAVTMLESGSDLHDDRADRSERHVKLRLEESKRHLEMLAGKLGEDGIQATWDASCNIGGFPGQTYSIQAGSLDTLATGGGYTHAPVGGQCDGVASGLDAINDEPGVLLGDDRKPPHRFRIVARSELGSNRIGELDAFLRIEKQKPKKKTQAYGGKNQKNLVASLKSPFFLGRNPLLVRSLASRLLCFL